jgi:hypothetical protein
MYRALSPFLDLASWHDKHIDNFSFYPKNHFCTWINIGVSKEHKNIQYDIVTYYLAPVSILKNELLLCH